MPLSRVMAPNHHYMLNALPLEPVSRTYQYRKIMKPMLERKRRARINRCLDELKDLMTATLQCDGENISKLEKADILELTVRHLHRLRESNALYARHSEALNMEKFWAGFQHCAAEVAQFLSKFDPQVSADLVKHITNFVPTAPATTAAQRTAALQTMAAQLKAASNQRFPTSTATSTASSEEGEPTATPPAAPTTPQPAATDAESLRHWSGEAGADKVRFRPYARVRADACEGGDGGVWRPW